MAKEMNYIDISGNPDLIRIAEEVNRMGKPYVLQEHNRKIAMITPLSSVKKRKGKQAKSREKYEAFLAAAGSWADVDVEQFKEDIYASRAISSRPPVEL